MLTVITGPPAAGKSTYVREHAKPGDIIIDFDTLAQALGSPTTHNHTPAHTHVATAARAAAINAARTCGVDVWLIHAQPTPASLAIYRKQHARIVELNPGEAVVRERIANERTPQTHRHATQWYAQRTGPRAPQSSAGRSSRRWRTLKANLKAQRIRDCWICHQPIDYAAPPQHPDAFEADHYYPVSTHPHLAEDPGNLRPSHVRCNRGRGNQAPTDTTWQQVEQW